MVAAAVFAGMSKVRSMEFSQMFRWNISPRTTPVNDWAKFVGEQLISFKAGTGMHLDSFKCACYLYSAFSFLRVHIGMV